MIECDPLLSIIINLKKYPINDVNSEEYRNIVQDARKSLRDKGGFSLPEFLTDKGLALILAQVKEQQPQAAHTERVGNAYDIPVTDDLPLDHVLRIEALSSYSSLGRSQLTKTAIELIYTSEILISFVADMLGLSKLYLHDDPYNAVVMMIYEPGDQLAWHFDYGHFVSLINLQEISQGGFHESAPNIRKPDDDCYDAVARVLRGGRCGVKQSRSTPGALTIFKGRYSMHRVTKVMGSKTRMSLVMTYEEMPGVRLDDEVRRRYFR